MPTRIAIDGPSGAGKSTLAKRIAANLGFVYVDTGALYRSIALAMLRKQAGTDAEIEQGLDGLEISFRHIDGQQHVFIGEEDVSDLIRTPEVTMNASRVSALPSVRAFLLELQRKIAAEQSVVMDGRDIGTVVLPDAEVKIYLTASAEKRAMRRFLEMQEKHISAQSYEEVLADVVRRDQQDMTRETAPLKQAEDAVLADTSELDLNGSEHLLMKIVKEKLGT
ncbi:MAG: (d)CMP kinase [Oscillospiraceae bacterium]|nr:(d)CMP kinase [Oscillospiraceae bacterium]